MNKQDWLKSHFPTIGTWLLIIFLIVLPLFAGDYQTDTVLRIMINAILIVSFRLISTTGLWSFGHVSIMSIGAYTSALLVIKLGMSFWVAMPVAVIVTGVAAWVLSFPLLRTRSYQFFLASFAIGQAIIWIWVLFFGSWSGYNVPKPTSLPGLESISFVQVRPFYYLIFIIAAVSLFIMYRLEHSKIGVTAKSIASNEALSKSVGINISTYQRLIFVIGSAFAGLAGVLYAFYSGSATPLAFNLNYNINLLIFTIIGGAESFGGPIVGLVLMTYVGDILSNRILQFLPMVYGGIFITVILSLPSGLMGLFQKIWARIFSPSRQTKTERLN